MNNETVERDLSPLRNVNGTLTLLTDDDLHWFNESEHTGDIILAVFNFTPVPRHNARVGVPCSGFWQEILNTDAPDYGGSGQGNQGGVEASPFGWHLKSHSLTLTLPPLGAVYLKQVRKPL